MPAERLDREHFDPRAEWTDHVIQVGAYKCPKCGAESEFSTNTLQEFECRRGTATDSGWNRRCEDVRPLNVWDSAFDVRCRGCSAPVRIIHGPNQSYAMSCWTYRILAIIGECDSSKTD